MDGEKAAPLEFPGAILGAAPPERLTVLKTERVATEQLQRERRPERISSSKRHPVAMPGREHVADAAPAQRFTARLHGGRHCVVARLVAGLGVGARVRRPRALAAGDLVADVPGRRLHRQRGQHFDVRVAKESAEGEGGATQTSDEQSKRATQNRIEIEQLVAHIHARVARVGRTRGRPEVQVGGGPAGPGDDRSAAGNRVAQESSAQRNRRRA